MTQHMVQNTGFKIHEKYVDIVEFEYRGQKYEVIYPKTNSMSITPVRIQHQDAQARIDRMLDQKTEAQQIDMDEIWAMYEA